MGSMPGNLYFSPRNDSTILKKTSSVRAFKSRFEQWKFRKQNHCTPLHEDDKLVTLIKDVKMKYDIQVYSTLSVTQQ